MGLQEIVDIRETTSVDAQGGLETVFQVVFTTEETSGSKTIEIPADEFSPDVARQRAQERAEELDQAITGETSE